MGHHQGHCNADHRKPVGCDMCSCEAGLEIKRLLEHLRCIAEHTEDGWTRVYAQSALRGPVQEATDD